MKKTEKIVFACLLLFLLLPNLVGLFVAQDLTSIGQRVIYLLTSLSFYGIGLCIWRKRTFFYVASAGLLFSAIELVHLIINQATTSLLFVFTIIKSERQEFCELLGTYWLVALLFCVLWAVYYYLNHTFITPRYLLPSRTWRYALLGVQVAFLIACVVGLKLRPKFRNEFAWQDADTRTAAWVGAEKACPVNFVLVTYHLCDMAYEIRRQNERLRYFTFDAQYTDNQNAAPLIVFLIGETSRYDHWQINGYCRETSPRLMKRNIVSFDSCFTVANLTTVSVPFMLSRATPDNQSLYLEEKSVVDAFHEAGYQTTWIADQSFNNHFLLRIAESCDNTHYVTARKGEQLLDTMLLEPLRTLLDRGGGSCSDGKQFVVIHSLGCHYKYSERYPDDFQRFIPDMKGMNIRVLVPDFDSIAQGVRLSEKENSPALVRNVKKVLVNSYDNAILYTDYMIDRTISLLEQTGRPALLLYVSDHGENLMDDERHMLLHGTYAGSIYEYHVPLFVWMSDGYKALYPEKAEAVQGNTRKVMTTMNIFHSLLCLGNISMPNLCNDWSIDNPGMRSKDTVFTIDANMNSIPLEYK